MNYFENALRSRFFPAGSLSNRCITKFRAVFIFETADAFNSFVNSGWEFGANAMADAKTKAEGGALAGAVTVSKGVKMFQLNDEGAIVGVSLTAAKYYKDKELN